MSWISESNNDGYWSSESERKYFNEFWDNPARRKWADEHDEDFLFYLSMLKDANKKEVEKYPRAVYNRKPYHAILKDLDPVPKGRVQRAKEPKVKSSTPEEMKRMVDEAQIAKIKRLAGVSEAEARKRLGLEPKTRKIIVKKKKPVEAAAAAPEPDSDDAERETMRMMMEDDDDEPPSRRAVKCPKEPPRPASSVRQTKKAMRGPNPNREGWKLPRKPYGHARVVVELEDDLTDAELKKMTSELPRRCLVEAVADWARDNNKIVLPSITRADKAEIVATIKEHRIPVPKMSGGGYYGDGMDDILTGGQIHNEVHLCRDCRMGDDEWDWIENERRTTQPYEIAGMGSAASIPRGDPAPRDDPMGEDTEEEDEDEEEEEELAFICDDCGERIMVAPGDPAYDGRREINGLWYCGDCAPEHLDEEEEAEEDPDTDSGPEGADTPRRARSPDGMDGGSKPIDKALYEKAKAIVYPKYKKPSAYRSGALIKKYKELGGRFKDTGGKPLARWFKEEWKDVGNKSYPVYRPTKRITKDTPLTPAEIDPKNLQLQIARKQKIKGNKNLSPFFHLRGAASQYDWGGDEDVYYDEDGKEVSKDEYEKDMSDGSEEDLPEQPQFVGDPSQFKIMPFDPNNPMMYMGSGDKGDYLKKAKAFAKKAGYKNWNNLKYATDGVHKLELDGVKFGRKGYGDFIDYGMNDGSKEAQKHRKAYLARATNIKGSWKDDPMSKNNLAIKVLWGGAKQPALPPNVDLVSKEESPIVEEIIEEPMDDTDIRAYYPNAKIMKYSDLKDYKTITQLLPKDKSFVFLLYQHAQNEGHWVLLMRYGTTIEFFCSYGSAIDAPLKWTNPRDRQMLGEAVPYLSNLLRAQKEFNVIHNPVQYQSKGSDKATCGAHDVMRLSQMLNHGQDLTDYYDYITRIKKESGLSYDEIVANFVSKR